MKKATADTAQVRGLLYEAPDTGLGGVKFDEDAARSRDNAVPRNEFSEYLEQARQHVQALLDVFANLDPAAQTPGCMIAAPIGECAVLAESKDHLNRELIGHVAKNAAREEARVLLEAFGDLEVDEERHLYHTTGWTRELWIESLGLPAVLSPPEEPRHVETAIGAARAEQDCNKKT